MVKELETLSRLIEEFANRFFRETLEKKLTGDERPVGLKFSEFVKEPRYSSILEGLERYRKKVGYNNLEDLAFNYLTPEQTRSIGSLFANRAKASFNGTGLQKKANLIDSKIINMPEYEQFVEISDHLTSEEKEKLAEKISRILYNKLSDEDKELINENILTRYLLNAGFIRKKRATEISVINFFKEYAPLFKEEQEVLSAILERHIKEELVKTLPKDTPRRIQELRLEIKEIYRSIGR